MPKILASDGDPNRRTPGPCPDGRGPGANFIAGHPLDAAGSASKLTGCKFWTLWSGGDPLESGMTLRENARTNRDLAPRMETTS
jgi:hypothetical protein